MLWRPRQQLADGSVIRYQTRRITVSAAGLPDTEVVTAHLAYHIKDFTNAIAMAIATARVTPFAFRVGAKRANFAFRPRRELGSRGLDSGYIIMMISS